MEVEGGGDLGFASQKVGGSWIRKSKGRGNVGFASQKAGGPLVSAVQSCEMISQVDDGWERRTSCSLVLCGQEKGGRKREREGGKGNGGEKSLVTPSAGLNTLEHFLWAAGDDAPAVATS